MRWMIETRCININTKVSQLSLYSARPRQGQFEAMLQIMGYLKLGHNSRLAFEPSYFNVDHSNFQKCDWADFSEDAVEGIPHNTPLPRGKESDLCMFIDSDHAGDKQTMRCRTSFMIHKKM